MMQNQAIKFSTPQKKEIKNIKRRLRRKNVETIEKLKSDWESEKKNYKRVQKMISQLKRRKVLKAYHAF